VADVTRVEIRGLLREQLFRRLLAVRVIGQFQDGLIQSALAGFILFSPESQDSPAAVVGAFALLLLPYSLIGPFMGVFLDHWRRRQVLVFANIARAFMVAALVAITWYEAANVWLGLLVLFVLGTNRLILTALAASLPRTVPASKLVAANAVAPVSGTIGAAIGGAIGVSVAATFEATRSTTSAILAVAAMGLLLTALLALRLPVTALGPDSDTPRETVAEVLHQLRLGATTLWMAKPAWWSVMGVLAHRTAYGVALLLVIVASRSVLSPDSNSEALGVFALVIGAAGVGALIGAIATPPLVRITSPARWSAGIVLVAAVVVTTGSLTVTVTGFMAAGFMLGMAGQSIKIDTDTVVALNIADDTRGRVFALLDVGINVALLTGIAIAGLAIGTQSTSSALTMLAGALLVVSFWAFVLSGRSHRNVIASHRPGADDN
jgi:MFS family permease